MDSPNETGGFCAVCSARASLVCGACRSVFYCCKEHQIAHWRAHRRNCRAARAVVPSSRPFHIEDDPRLGKQWVATEDLKAGSVILDELAAVAVWNQISSFENFLCLSCAGVKPSYRCSQCQWPVCGEACEAAAVHAENECGIFKEREIPFPPSPGSLACSVTYFPFVLYFIRVLGLRRREPGAYKGILNLFQNTENESVREREEVIRAIIAVVDLIKMHPVLHPPPEELPTLYRAFKTNAFSRSTKEGEMACLYLKTSRMNHSCVPNCSWEIGDAPQFIMRVRAAVDIKKGEPLTLSYLGRLRTMGTLERQESLRTEGGFICTCDRCTDPTELGSYSSAVTCSECRPSEIIIPPSEGADSSNSGYLLQKDPFNFNVEEASVWECNGCGAWREGASVDTTTTTLQLVIDSHWEKVVEMAASEGGCCKGLAPFLDAIEPSTRVVHPHHFILQSVSMKIWDLFYRITPEELDSQTCAIFEDQLRQILGIQNKVSPGVTRIRANLQRDLATLLTFQLSSGPLERGQFKEKLLEAVHLREEALVYYKNELPGRGEAVSKSFMELREINEKYKSDCIAKL